MSKREAFLCFAVVLTCVLSIGILFSTSFAEPPSYQIWLMDYPFYVEAGENISFTVSLQAKHNPVSDYFLDVYLNDELMVSKQIEVIQDMRKNYSFSVQADINESKNYETRIEFYSPDIPAENHGSKSSPYYLFFKVGVL